MSQRVRIAAIGLILAGVAASLWWFGPRGPAPIERTVVIKQYASIAHAVFSDSLLAARELQGAVDQLTTHPGPKTLDAARKAWRAARVPYMQSEVFRFGNPPVDANEGQRNAWPLDEGLIDYVEDDYVFEQGNRAAQANLIANPILHVGNREIDTTEITPQKLADLNEIGGSEPNVATGYHTIEFLLWGQDLNGTNPGAGERPYTDYAAAPEACADGKTSAPAAHCKRRAAYLEAVTQLLVNDLETLVAEWAPDTADNYRAKFVQALPEDEALCRMLFGMGSLTLGELAGERMKVALIAHSTEDEHDCFSDNTHNSHYYDALGIANVYHGEYQRSDGSLVSGANLEDLLAAADEPAAAEFDAALESALADLNTLVNAAEKGELILISSSRPATRLVIKKCRRRLIRWWRLPGELKAWAPGLA